MEIELYSDNYFVIDTQWGIGQKSTPFIWGYTDWTSSIGRSEAK